MSTTYLSCFCLFFPFFVAMSLQRVRGGCGDSTQNILTLNWIWSDRTVEYSIRVCSAHVFFLLSSTSLCLPTCCGVPVTIASMLKQTFFLSPINGRGFAVLEIALDFLLFTNRLNETKHSQNRTLWFRIPCQKYSRLGRLLFVDFVSLTEISPSTESALNKFLSFFFLLSLMNDHKEQCQTKMLAEYARPMCTLHRTLEWWMAEGE